MDKNRVLLCRLQMATRMDGWTFRPFMRVTPPPPFWNAVFRGVLGRTQYAKGQYAVGNNSVKSYAALKNSQFFNRFP